MFSIKILSVIFVCELDWQEQVRAVCSSVVDKLLVLQRIGGTLNTLTLAQFYKICFKPHIEYCLPVWTFCGFKLKKLNYIICRANKIITNCRLVVIKKSNFKQFCLTKFFGIVVLSVLPVSFLITCTNANISVLSQINKTMSKFAYVFKSYITLSQKSFNNCFLLCS